jgi:predicted DNA-binding transcriptional regulator YafY
MWGVLLVLALGVGLILYAFAGAGRASREVGYSAAEAARQRREAEIARLAALSLGRVDMEYADADGVLTRREVLILEIDADQGEDGKIVPTRFRAWCLLRNDQRHFLVPRVQRVFLPAGRVAQTAQDIAEVFRDLIAQAQRRRDVRLEKTARRRRRHS